MATAPRERPILQPALALATAVVVGGSGLALGLLLTLVTAGVLSFGVGIEMTPVRFLVLGLVTAQGIVFPIVSFAYLKSRPFVGPVVRELLALPESREPLDIGVSVPNLRDLGIVILGYGAALAGVFVASILISTLVTWLGVETGQNQAAQIGMENPEVILLLIPASFLLIGPGEELLFRGVVQGRIREVFGPAPGIFIASVIFAGIHIFALSGGSLTGNLLVLSVLLIPSLILGTAYEYTGNIVVPSLIHGAYNATLFTGLYVVVKYSDQLSEAAVLAPLGGL